MGESQTTVRSQEEVIAIIQNEIRAGTKTMVGRIVDTLNSSLCEFVTAIDN